MNKSHLYDLDELALRCYSESSKQNIDEAIRNYKIGAYRSCIVSTWIAVYFDLVDKLRALSSARVETAVKWIKEYDKLAKEYDPAKFNETTKKLLDKERVILEVCTAPAIGILRKVERHELERLREDRNKCAHPTMIDDLEQFSPTAELARTHIRVAIEYVLSKRAIPGRLAADRILGHCRSEYFASEPDEALEELSTLYSTDLDEETARPVVTALLDDIFDTELDAGKRQQRIAALQALHSLASGTAESVLATKIRTLAAEHDPKIWVLAIGSLRRLEWSWSALDDVSRDLVRRVVKKSNIGDKAARRIFREALHIPALAETAIERLPEQPLRITFSWRQDIGIERFLPLLTKAIEETSSWGEAISILLMIEQADDLLESEFALRSILSACSQNDQVYGCYEMPAFLRHVLTLPEPAVLSVLREFKGLVHACLTTKAASAEDRTYLSSELERLVEVAGKEPVS